jgi:hypothetical protein
MCAMVVTGVIFGVNSILLYGLVVFSGPLLRIGKAGLLHPENGGEPLAWRDQIADKQRCLARYQYPAVAVAQQHHQERHGSQRSFHRNEIRLFPSTLDDKGFQASAEITCWPTVSTTCFAFASGICATCCSSSPSAAFSVFSASQCIKLSRHFVHGFFVSADNLPFFFASVSLFRFGVEFAGCFFNGGGDFFQNLVYFRHKWSLFD